MATAPTPIRLADKQLLAVVVNMTDLGHMKWLKLYLFELTLFSRFGAAKGPSLTEPLLLATIGATGSTAPTEKRSELEAPPTVTVTNCHNFG